MPLNIQLELSEVSEGISDSFRHNTIVVPMSCLIGAVWFMDYDIFVVPLSLSSLVINVALLF